MGIDYAALKSEILNDPARMGYGPMVSAGNDSGIANLLDMTTGPGAGTAPHDPILAADFMALLDPTELENLTLGQKADVQMYLAAGQVNIGAENVQAWIAATWTLGSCPHTYATLVGLSTRPASRAEVLFGPGTWITPDDISKALRGQ